MIALNNIQRPKKVLPVYSLFLRHRDLIILVFVEQLSVPCSCPLNQRKNIIGIKIQQREQKIFIKLGYII